MHWHCTFQGTHVIQNLTSCHRNPDYWKSPMEFRPEHFLDDKGEFIEDKEGYLPFGFGLRRCPGEDIANMETFLILSNLLQAFLLK